MGKGRILAEKTGVGGQGQFYQRGVNDYLVSGGFLLSLSMCKRVFHDLLRVRPFSLLMLHPSTPILGITSTLNAYEDGTASKFRNVGTKSSDARRLPKRHNSTFICVYLLVYQESLKYSSKRNKGMEQRKYLRNVIFQRISKINCCHREHIGLGTDCMIVNVVCALVG